FRHTGGFTTLIFTIYGQFCIFFGSVLFILFSYTIIPYRCEGTSIIKSHGAKPMWSIIFPLADIVILISIKTLAHTFSITLIEITRIYGTILIYICTFSLITVLDITILEFRCFI